MNILLSCDADFINRLDMKSYRIEDYTANHVLGQPKNTGRC